MSFDAVSNFHYIFWGYLDTAGICTEGRVDEGKEGGWKLYFGNAGGRGAWSEVKVWAGFESSDFR